MPDDSNGDRPETHEGQTHLPRATQTIPPATRRLVMRRDRRRCVVPGCKNHMYLDVHHLDPRAEGGTHDPDRLACLCGSHHRCVHLGTLTIEGTATEGFRVRHADGAPYGGPLHPRAADLARQTLDALTHMGFKTTQARAAIDRVLAGSPPERLADFVRAALRQA